MKGRSKVEQSIQIIQRLQLQLDRSDGRPDFTPDVLAEKYYDFLSTCLRTEGAAWTATLGPMEYVGLRMKDCIQVANAEGQNLRSLDVSKLCDTSAKILLDMPTGTTPIEKAMLMRLGQGDAQRGIWDLGEKFGRTSLYIEILSNPPYLFHLFMYSLLTFLFVP
jgi:hypothetical protein